MPNYHTNTDRTPPRHLLPVDVLVRSHHISLLSHPVLVAIEEDGRGRGLDGLGGTTAGGGRGASRRARGSRLTRVLARHPGRGDARLRSRRHRHRELYNPERIDETRRCPRGLYKRPAGCPSTARGVSRRVTGRERRERVALLTGGVRSVRVENRCRAENNTCRNTWLGNIS